MARIVISLSGEGRGHATRVRVLAERLRGSHDLVIFAPGDAFDFLAPRYEGSDVRVRRLTGLRFHYHGNGRLALGRTGRGALRYARDFGGCVDQLTREVASEEPDLALVDFEPVLPRVARRLGIPCLSFDHQHFLVTYDLRCLPRRLRWYAWYMGWIVRAYCSGQQETLVSSFFFPPLRPGCRRVTQLGVLLRPEVLRAASEDRGHLVAYFRRFASARVMEALARTGRETRIFGLGPNHSTGRLTFHAVEEGRFLEDLATCSALVCTAGNQLVGEALYLGKPVFAMPESRNHEPYINAEFLRHTGAGWARGLETVGDEDLLRFLGGLDRYRGRIQRDRLHGWPAAWAVLRRYLEPQSGEARELAVPTVSKSLAEAGAVSV